MSVNDPLDLPSWYKVLEPRLLSNLDEKVSSSPPESSIMIQRCLLNYMRIDFTNYVSDIYNLKKAHIGGSLYRVLISKFRELTPYFLDLFLGVSPQNSERNSASPQMRSVSCSELQVNGVSYSHINGKGVSGFANGDDLQNSHHQITRSFNGSLPPSGNQQHHPIYQPKINGQSQGKYSQPLKSSSNGKLSNIVMFLKSPKLSLRRSSSRSNKCQQANTVPIVEDGNTNRMARRHLIEIIFLINRTPESLFQWSNSITASECSPSDTFFFLITPLCELSYISGEERIESVTYRELPPKDPSENGLI
ncbi:hypothetical protein ACTXT7_004234 [Hymenolepis weldensis]